MICTRFSLNTRILALFVFLLIFSAISSASIQRPKWTGWELDIRNNQCKLSNEFRVHPDALDHNGGFLQGTTFERIRLIFIVKTHSRDANKYRLGEPMFMLHIRSHSDLDIPNRIAVGRFGGIAKNVVDWGERSAGDQMYEKHAYFAFYGAEVETLLSRLSQGGGLALSFDSFSGGRVVETVFENKESDRFRAWEAAFRGCAMANLE